MWVHVVKAIYGKDAGFDHMPSTDKRIWRNLVGSINHLHDSCIVPKDTLKYKVGYGTKVIFWMDKWISDGPLALRYNRLYRLDVQTFCFIKDRFINREWQMQWKRPMVSSRINALWESLQGELQQATHFEGQDEVRWGIGHDGTFTVKATRHQIDDAMLPTLDVSTMFCKILPKKVNIFFWRLNLDSLSHRLNLSR